MILNRHLIARYSSLPATIHTRFVLIAVACSIISIAQWPVECFGRSTLPGGSDFKSDPEPVLASSKDKPSSDWIDDNADFIKPPPNKAQPIEGIESPKSNSSLNRGYTKNSIESDSSNLKQSGKYVRRFGSEPEKFGDPYVDSLQPGNISQDEIDRAKFDVLVRRAKQKDLTGDWLEAARTYSRALEYAGNLGQDKLHVENIVIRLAYLYKMTGEVSLANRCYLVLANIAKEANRKSAHRNLAEPASAITNAVNTQLLIADALAEAGDNAAAEVIIVDMQTGLSGDFLFYVQALAAERLARLRVQEGRVEEASVDINELSKIVESDLARRSDYLGLKTYLNTLSARISLANAQKDYETAKVLSKKCLTLAPTLKGSNQYIMFRSLADRAATYRLEKDFYTAIDYYDKALTVARQGIPLSMVYQRPILGEQILCYAALGRVGKVESLKKRVSALE